MALLLKLLRGVLCKFRFTRGLVHNFFGRWVLFLAFLGRRLGVWHPWSNRGRGAFQRAEKAESSSLGNTTRLRECGVAASYIPASASHPSLHNTSGTSQQPQPTTASSATPPAADLTVEPPSHRDHANPSSAFEAKIHSNRRSTDSSIRSCSSDRLSIIQTHSRESVHTSIGRPTQFPRDHQSGRGPSTYPSRERSSSSPSPTDRIPQPRLEVDVTSLRPQTQVHNGNSPIYPPSATPHTDAQLSPPGISGFRSRRSSTTSVVVEVVNPSTDSLPHRFFTGEPPLTEEPYTIGHLSVVDTLDLREGLPEHNPATSSSSVTSDFDLPYGRFLQMIHSEQVPRYSKDVTVQVPRENILCNSTSDTDVSLRPLPSVSKQMSFEQGSLKEDCAPWVPATHPDGALYFFDKDRRLFTDTDMLDPVLREEMEDFYHYLQRTLDHDGVAIPSKNYDLALDIMRLEDGRIHWSYYYACHETRCLFWLGPYHADHMISELHGVRSPAHVKHRLEELFWIHWSLFPAVFEGRRLDRAAVDELVGMLSHGCMDVMTSKSSTLPYDADTLQKMLALVQNVKESNAGLMYHTAGVTHWRFLYFHGQDSARLERHRTVYAHPYRERSLLITLLSPAFFFAPEGYLRSLELVWVDEVIIEIIWKGFISRLLKEWEQLILSSTVMLSVNVGFLAVPGVVVSNLNNITGANQLVIFTSPAQIASCMSIVASAGSIVIGLLLVRRSSPQQNQDPAGSLSALRQSGALYMSTHQIFGLEPLAIILSLPWALLMWSMVTFFVALLLFCFGTSNTLTRIFVAVTSAVVVVLVGWCIRHSCPNHKGAGYRSSTLENCCIERGINGKGRSAATSQNYVQQLDVRIDLFFYNSGISGRTKERVKYKLRHRHRAAAVGKE
ncbi:hypothetical protein EDB86DRAFT_2826626 [Lactarius hatsudake]|nr:hypothetical protein EDB86DRAFT_2826626 [Lactarius hatsudake]